MENQRCFTHRLVLVKDFVEKNNVTTLERPPYHPDHAVADFYLFPGLKSALKGRHFRDPADIINPYRTNVENRVSS